jgi:hypothetical protein
MIPMHESLLIVIGQSAAADDFLAHAQDRQPVHLPDSGSVATYSGWNIKSSASIVWFVVRREGRRNATVIDKLAMELRRLNRPRLCMVTSFSAHFGDQRILELERQAMQRLRCAGVGVTIIRPSRVLNMRALCSLRRWSWWAALVPARLSSCFLDRQALLAAIDQSIGASDVSQTRILTLLGANRPWQQLFREHLGPGHLQLIGVALTTMLSWLMVGELFAALLALLARFVPSAQSLNFDTIRPESTRELLALVNPHNVGHIKIVGYNNGVTHFGQRFNGKTIISTVRCNQYRRVFGCRAVFDAGVTIHQAVEVLNRVGKELYVLPNFSYVSLGTAFFVPIHGSASVITTLGDTIEEALLYDPLADRFIRARRGQPAFDNAIYDLDRTLLLVRLHLRIKDKSRYYRSRQSIDGPHSDSILAAFRDQRAANVEIRKAKAASAMADIYRYYTQNVSAVDSASEFPRDRMGRLWDRIEQNRVTATLFHGFMRRFGFHVEMFLSPDDFAVFWKSHMSLPIAKIQLRYIKRDDFPHSPFRDHDCVSADLFMLRKHKGEFERYVQSALPGVRFNPGKHSV